MLFLYPLLQSSDTGQPILQYSLKGEQLYKRNTEWEKKRIQKHTCLTLSIQREQLNKHEDEGSRKSQNLRVPEKKKRSVHTWFFVGSCYAYNT